MKKRFIRTLALIVMTVAISLLLTGCLLGGASTGPSASAADETELAYADRELSFVHAQSIQVNYSGAMGYFCFKDNEQRILLPSGSVIKNGPLGEADSGAAEPSETPDYSIRVSVTVYDGAKNEDGSNVLPADRFECEFDKNGYLCINSPVLGEAEIDAVCANGSRIPTENIPIARKPISLIDVVILGIGVYLLFSAIIGKGSLFKNEFVVEGMEKRHKTIVRVTALVIALLMIATFVITLLDKTDHLRILRVIFFGLMLVIFVTAMLLLRPCTDQEAKRKAREQGSAAPVASPKDAFEFDEDEPTVDEINNDTNK